MSLREFVWKKIKAEKWPTNAKKPPAFQSHRGFHLTGIQENTLDALIESKARGALGAEIDVQITKDKVPVLFHDKDLKRFFGVDLPLADLTWKEVKKLRSIPSLEEVLKNPQVPDFINIELKSAKIRSPLAREVAKVVRNTKSSERVMFSSFNPFALKSLEREIPEVPRALLVTRMNIKENPWYLQEMVFAPFLKIHMLNLDCDMIDDSGIEFWKKKNMPVSVWTLTEVPKACDLLKRGIQSIIADIDPQNFPK